jgi:hypothetical protein
MASYQIYVVNDQFNLKSVQNSDILNNVKPEEGDPNTVKLFLDSAKKAHRNLQFESLDGDSSIMMKVEEQVEFTDKQTIWFKREKVITQIGHYLIVGKTEKRFEKVIQLYLRGEAGVKPLEFTTKKLWDTFGTIKKNAEKSGLEIRLYRVILKNTFIESDKISELNIQANNIQDLSAIKEIIKQADKIRVLTVQIRGITKDEKKWFTVRLDHRGSLQLYGTYSPKTLQKVLELIFE